MATETDLGFIAAAPRKGPPTDEKLSGLHTVALWTVAIVVTWGVLIAGVLWALSTGGPT